MQQDNLIGSSEQRPSRTGFRKLCYHSLKIGSDLSTKQFVTEWPNMIFSDLAKNVSTDSMYDRMPFMTENCKSILQNPSTCYLADKHFWELKKCIKCIDNFANSIKLTSAMFILKQINYVLAKSLLIKYYFVDIMYIVQINSVQIFLINSQIYLIKNY